MRNTQFSGINGVCCRLHVQLDGTNRIIITGDHVIDSIHRVIRIDNANHRDTQLPGLGNGNIFVADIDDKHGIRDTAHVLDAAETAFQFFQFTGQHQTFFLAEPVQRTIG